jgi:glycosyltransferase involved in cell wall biosynthesis
MRRIASLEPTWRLTVVGAKPEGILLPTGPNIVYVGLVDRIEPYFQAAHAMLCPVFSGTGIKTKVLTAMAFRRPVIATAVALECIPAIDGVHVLQAETEDDFLAAMQRLVGDQTLQASLAIRAFELVRDHFSIQAISRNIASLVVQR